MKTETSTIDLRSDTVTLPSKEMKEAMLSAPLGDDVFGEDPTVIKLEEMLAKMFGKEAGIFCPSGTMTNQIAIQVHTKPGDEVICDAASHIYNYEGGGISRNAGVQARLIQGDRGRLSAQQIEAQINDPLDWLSRTSLVSLENTVNRAGGSYYSPESIAPISELCKKSNLKLHLDGARIFNALAETKEPPHEAGKLFDSISVCLSKGLGAPAGSVLLGNQDFIREARRTRKVMGGGMRQSGLLAAAGIYALENNVKRLSEDHRRAKEIERILKQLPFVENVLPADTNIVIFNLKAKMSGGQFEKSLSSKGVKVASFGKQTIRMVTHLDFTDPMLEQLIVALKGIEC